MRWAVALTCVQIICASFFVFEFVTEVAGLRRWAIPFALREVLQILASLGLILGAIASALLVRHLRRSLDRSNRHLAAASGAFLEVMEERFTDWQLSQSEKDVALFALRGCSNAEIAVLRGKSEATIKTQINAVFRKAGVSGRPQLLSLFLDVLIAGDLPALPDRYGAALDHVKV